MDRLYTEAAVVAEQKRMESIVASATPKVPDELAFVADLVVSKCTACNRLMAQDFDGCLALKCGRTIGGGPGQGCGAELCGYCGEQCEGEIAVHLHLQTCVWNPRPNNMFPKDDYPQILQQVRRERVWYHVVATVFLQQQTPEIWTRIHRAYPDLGITPEWLQERDEWLSIASEMHISFDDFAPLVPKFARCLLNMTDMGFESRARCMRATMLANGDATQAAITLLANDD